MDENEGPQPGDSNYHNPGSDDEQSDDYAEMWRELNRGVEDIKDYYMTFVCDKLEEEGFIEENNGMWTFTIAGKTQFSNPQDLIIYIATAKYQDTERDLDTEIEQAYFRGSEGGGHD